LSEIARHEHVVQIPDIALTPEFPFRETMLDAGFRAALIVPLIGPQGIVGALVVENKRPGRFAPNSVALMQAFAHQSALAMHNGRLFAQIEENGRQLAIASEHKSRFFANMSHELRTPLNAVLGYAELLQDGLYGELPQPARQVLERVRASGEHLLGLINDILDLSKLEAGELALVLEDYSLRNLIEQTVNATASLAQAKKLQLTYETPETLPIGHGDERRLRQILLNMVSNAIKFTDIGSVTINARVEGQNFEIVVKDTGPGIAAEDHQRIFDAFQQVDNTSTRQKGGTGLGLSISKRFVEMHGGTIGIVSCLGDGSAFWVRLPIRAKQKKAVK
jgi:signal transduction histidine kinase